MKYLFSFLSIFLLFSSAQAVELLYISDYDWKAKPSLHKIPEKWAEKNEVIVEENTIIEYAHDEAGQFSMYTLDHNIIHLNTSEAVDNNNKLYLPFSSESSSIIIQKARVIKPNGKTILLQQDDIQEAEDEGSGYKYKYFALDGLEVGDEIEYIFKLKRSASYYGRQVMVQNDQPKMHYSYKIVSPSHLLFAYKGYNGFPGMELDSTKDEHNILSLEIDSLPHLQDENGALYDANCMQFVYKLEENLASRSKNIVNYTDAAKYFHNLMIGEGVDKKERKSVKKFVRKLNLDDELNQVEMIKAVEDHIKQEIKVIDINVPSLSNIREILDQGYANENGITKLFMLAFEQLEIQTDLVITCDRTELKFDRDFEAFNFLDNYLLYFPEIDQYMDPTDRTGVLGMVHWPYTHNYGLFVSTLEMSGVKSGVGEIRYIPYPKRDESVSNTQLKVNFSDDIMEPSFTYHSEETGYYAWAQPYYSIRDEEWAEETNEAQVKYITENMEIEEVEVSNTAWEDYGDKPYVVDATFTSNEFVEKAANKYLFKVGELIGPQMDLYQEDEERDLPVEEGHTRTYERTIVFDIPAGYTCDNLDDIKINQSFDKDGETLMMFKSSYSRKGNTITIKITEYYAVLDVDMADYPHYKSVVNAAADFNKVTMVFEPETE